MKEQRVLVIGGFGFIGSALINKLSSFGYSVTSYGHFNQTYNYNFSKDVRCIYGDFNDLEKLKSVLYETDVVYHLLGNSTPISSLINPSADIKQNLLPTLDLFESCVQAGVKKLIFASSGGTIYGIPEYLPIDEKHITAPISAYGINKLSIEHYMRLYSSKNPISMTSIRLANPYGPFQNISRGQGIIGTFCDDYIFNRPLKVWGDGSVIRDYIYIDDVVSALEKAIVNFEGFEVYNLGSGIGVSVNELLRTLNKITGSDLVINRLPGREVDVPSNILSITKFCEKFNWYPTVDLEDGMRKTLLWHRNLHG